MDKPASYGQRKLEVMRSTGRLRKDKWNEHHRYAFAGHDDVTAALVPAFCKVGILQSVVVESEERQPNGAMRVVVQVRWESSDDRNDGETVRTVGESQPPGKGGPTPQQLGSAISYAVKFAQTKCFCLVGDDTPDADGEPAGDPPTQAAEGLPNDAVANILEDFGKVKNRDQYVKLMTSVAAVRSTFSAAQMEQLKTAAREAESRIK